LSVCIEKQYSIPTKDNKFEIKKEAVSNRRTASFFVIFEQNFQMKAFQINIILVICYLLLSSWSLKPAQALEGTSASMCYAPIKPKVAKNKAKKIKKVRPPHDYGHRTQMSAFLLCLLLGFSGAHQFYLQRYGVGITQLGLSVAVLLLFSAGLTLAAALAWLMALVLSIWLVVDIFLLIFGGIRPKSGQKLIPWD